MAITPIQFTLPPDAQQLDPPQSEENAQQYSSTQNLDNSESQLFDMLKSSISVCTQT